MKPTHLFLLILLGAVGGCNDMPLNFIVQSFEASYGDDAFTPGARYLHIINYACNSGTVSIRKVGQGQSAANPQDGSTYVVALGAEQKESLDAACNQMDIPGLDESYPATADELASDAPLGMQMVFFGKLNPSSPVLEKQTFITTPNLDHLPAPVATIYNFVVRTDSLVP